MTKISIEKSHHKSLEFTGTIKPILMNVGIGMSIVLMSLSSSEINGFTAKERSPSKTLNLSLFHLPSPNGEYSDIKTSHRLCPKCGDPKQLSEFYKNKSKPDGHESHCKVCVLKKKKRKIKQLGGTIELEVTMKRSHNFIVGLDLVLDMIALEVTKNA